MTDRFLVLHEEVEKSLIDQLGLHYVHAHQIATRAEQAAVRAAGISWGVYDRFMRKYVKRDGNEQRINVPVDLDTKPYRDEHDFELLRRMIAATERGPIPSPQSKGGTAKDRREGDARGRHEPPGVNTLCSAWSKPPPHLTASDTGARNSSRWAGVTRSNITTPGRTK
jgi:hypothetical protein